MKSCTKSDIGHLFGRKNGRPPLGETAEETVRVNITMTIAQRDRLHELGGSIWIRRKIDGARKGN